MRHWIGRVDIPSGNITLLHEVDSSETARGYILNTTEENKKIMEVNNKLKELKESLLFNIPKFDKEVHETLHKWLKLKDKLKRAQKSSLCEEDQKIYHAAYLKELFPKWCKLVYVAVHEMEEI